MSQIRNHSQVASSGGQGARIAFCATLIAAPQMLGGQPTWSQLVLFVLFAIAFLATLYRYGNRVYSLNGVGPIVIVTLLATVAWTALQVLPLPCFLVHWIAPSSYAKWIQAYSFLGMSKPAMCTISLSPLGTYKEVIKGFVLVMVFTTSFIVVSGGRFRLIVRVVAGSITLIALVGLLHKLLGAEKLYGIYAPNYVQPIVLSPILNANHFSGLLAMGTILFLGLLVTAQDAYEKIASAVGFVLLGLVSMLGLSRGGFVVLLGGVAYFVTSTVRQSRKNQKTSYDLAKIALLVSLVVALVAYLGFDATLERFAKKSYSSRWDLFANAFRFAFSQPITGYGRGVFDNVFANYAGSTLRFQYPENIVLQWVSEWGLPFSLALAAVMIWGFSPYFKRRDPLIIATVVAVTAIVSQNVVDFSLELLGISTLVVALLGGLAAMPVRDRNFSPMVRKLSDLFRQPVTRHVAYALTALVVVFALITAPTLLRNDEQQLQRRVAKLIKHKRSVTHDETVRSTLLTHPTEPKYVVLVADQLLKANRPHTLRWVNRAMILAPGWVTPRLQAAYWLFQNSYDWQAMLHVRDAAMRDVAHTSSFLCQVSVGLSDSSLVLDAVPQSGEARHQFLDTLASCLNNTFPTLVQTLDNTLMRERPQLPAAYERSIARLMQKRDFQASAQLARRAVELGARSSGIINLWATALLEGGKPEEAVAVLKRMMAKGHEDFYLAFTMARALRKLGRFDEMRFYLSRFAELANGDIAQIGKGHMLRGSLELESGNLGRALRAYEEAYRTSANVGALIKVAEISERLGESGRALHAYQLACSNGDDATLRKQACLRYNKLKLPGHAHDASTL